MNLNFTTINDTFYKINKQLQFSLNDINIPFKLSKYKNNYYLNLEINIDKNNKNQKFINEYNNIENYINDLNNINDIEISKYRLYSNLKINNFNNNTFYLYRTQLKKNKNIIISKYKINNIETNIFNIESKEIYNITIEITGIWINHINKQYGITLNIICIYK